MNITLIVRLICYAVGLALIASFPIKTKQLKTQAGKCVLPLQRTSSKLYIVAIVLCFAVIFIMRFRSFQLYITVLIDVACVLGINLAVRETIYRRASGVYENALITDGELLPREEILSVPVLDYEQDENGESSENAYENTLKIVTEKSGVKWIAFASAEEKQAVLTILKTWF